MPRAFGLELHLHCYVWGWVGVRFIAAFRGGVMIGQASGSSQGGEADCRSNG